MSDFKAWLHNIALEQHHDLLRKNSIDLDIIAELTENDLVEMGLNLGDRRRMLAGIKALSATHPAGLPGLHEEAAIFQTPQPIRPFAAGRSTELRQLTLMFVDLVESTRLSTQLDLENYRAALHDYQNCCLRAVRANYGHVAQFVGDGVIAYFGYPMTEENDAERAVIAALDICSSIGEVKVATGQRLNVRIGLSSGYVVVDEDDKLGGLVFGDVPNLAARVQSVADPGAVAISEETRQLLGDNFTLKNKGHYPLKGFDEPVEIWQVTDVNTTEMRFRSRHAGHITPLVNRDVELTLLKSCLSAARKGVGQAVMLSGEAGIGKSRIVEALIEGLEPKSCLRLNFQCLPNHEGSAYSPVITFVSQMAGIVRSDTDAGKLEKLRGLLADWNEDADSTLALFAHLMSIPHAALGGDGELAPDDLKEQIQDTLVRLVVNLSARKPVLLLFEDLHWIDPSSEDLIDLLVDRLRDLRVLVICTFRPSYHPRWTGLARVTSMSVARLDHKHTLQMLGNLLTAGSVSPEIEQQIAERTDGVPLFLEEMARMVARRFDTSDPHHLPGEVLALPSTLKELLRATIDKLVSARAIIPICAAIGRNILPSMVQQVSGETVKTTDLLLEQLVDAQILVPRGAGADRSFYFRHALIQDAAYELMLPSQARAVHRRIVEVMANGFGDLAQNAPEILAHHYTHADMPSQARDAWCAAAILASSRSGTEETVGHLNAALRENVKVASKEERDREEIALRKMFNVALNTRAFGSVEVLDNISRLHEVLNESDMDSVDAFLALHVQHGAKLMLSDPEAALLLYPELGRIADRADNPTMKALAEHNAGMSNFMLDDLDTAIAKFDLALEWRKQSLEEEILKYHAADIRDIDISMRCWALALRDGDTPQTRSELTAAIDDITTTAHEFSRCYGLNILATAYQVLGDRGALINLIETASKISTKRKFHYWEAWSAIMRGWARARGDNPTLGIDEINAGIEAYLQTGSTQITLYARTLLADAYLAAGDPVRGLSVIEEVRAGEKTSSVRYQCPMTDRVEADLRKAKKAKGSE